MKTMLDPVVADAGNGAFAIDLLNTLNERRKVSLVMHGSGRPRKKLEFWESEQTRPELLRAFEKTSEGLRKGRLPASCATPFGPALLVTQGQYETSRPSRRRNRFAAQRAACA
jgi:hypothetical protein